MRVRVLVVAAFLAMVVVPVWLAWHTGVVSGPSQASAQSAVTLSMSSQAVTSIVWPKDPLALAASTTRVYWEQRDPDRSVSGIWYYDVTSGEVRRLLDRRGAGRASGFLAAAGDLVVWSSWAGRRGVGTPSVQAYDGLSSRRWRVAGAGRAAAAADGIAVWAEPRRAGRGGDVIRGVDILSDDEYTVGANGAVRALAAAGPRLAWITGGGRNEVWTASFGDAARHRLGARGTAVAVDADRVVWAAKVDGHTSAIVAWDPGTARATVLCRQPGSVSSLALNGRFAAWATGGTTAGARVWVYDFGRRSAYQVGAGGGRQVSPVIVAGSVYWAGDRTGHWELYSRSLQH